MSKNFPFHGSTANTLFVLLILFTLLGHSVAWGAKAGGHYNCRGSTWTPDDRFEILGETALDKRTNLTWMRCPEGLKLDGEQCVNVTKGDNHLFEWQKVMELYPVSGEGWRLPNIDELASIRSGNSISSDLTKLAGPVFDGCTSPGLNPKVFPLVASEKCWSASQSQDRWIFGKEGVGLTMNFDGGHLGNYFKSDYYKRGNCVRLVKGNPLSGPMAKSGYKTVGTSTELAAFEYDTKARVAACRNAKVPNPSPIENESTDFYGDCKDGNATDGIVVWKQFGQPTTIDCLAEGKYVNASETKLDTDKNQQCGKYFVSLPNYCKRKYERNGFPFEYFGQCLNGVPNGIGVEYELHEDYAGHTKSLYSGNFSGGSFEGFGRKQTAKPCGSANSCGVTASYGMWINGNKSLDCDNLGECRIKIEASRRQKEQLAAEEAKFQSTLNLNNPQPMYLAASRYESDGERGRAKTIYRKIVDRFGNNPIAIKAADRLTQLADVEAVESSNSRAAYEVQRSRNTSYQQCQNNRDACFRGCNGLKGWSAQSSCQNGCPICAQ